MRLVVGRQPREPAVEHQRRPGLVAGRSAGRTRSRQGRPVRGSAVSGRPTRRAIGVHTATASTAGTAHTSEGERPAAEQRRPSGTARALEMVAPIIIATTYAPVAAPARAPRWFLTTPVSSTPATPMPRPTRTLPPTSAMATGTPRTALPSATRPTAPPSAGLRPNRAPSDRPDERPERHHQHRAGLHQPGSARVDAEVGTDRLQQRRVGRQCSTQVDGEREHAEQHDRRAHPPGPAQPPRPGPAAATCSRHRPSARRAAVGWSHQKLIRDESARADSAG